MSIRIVHVSELKKPVRVPKPKKETVSAKELLALHTKFRENLIRKGTL